MRILYLDTSSSFLYCGIVEENNLIFSIKKELGKDMSRDTLFEISKKFDENNIHPKSIEKIVLVNGPGSFTGVRIAITIAKTYAWALKIPVVVISSLYAMAISSKVESDFIIPFIDARRGYCYSAIYDKEYNIVMKEQYISINALNIAINSLGDNYAIISNDESLLKHFEYNPDILKIVSVASVLEPVKDSNLITANYLKSTEAEENLND